MTKIYFYCCPPGPPESQAFQHALICLAEGLRALGVPFYSNVNYWRLSPETDEHLFVHDPSISPDDCSIVVLDTEWITYGHPLPEGLFKKGRKYKTIYIELHELMHSVGHEFRQFDIVYRGSYNNHLSYESNVKPWAYGLSERILSELQKTDEKLTRKECFLFNYRHSRPVHSVRKAVARDLIPILDNVLTVDARTDKATSPPSEPYHYLQWDQTGRRHYPQYYQRLLQSTACASFGGFFVSSWPRRQRSYISRVLKNVIGEIGYKTNTVQQWASWRFWESLAAGCATLHVDLEKYGCELPVMPENWKHYIGVDFADINATISRIIDDPSILEKVGAEGRLWAIENYAPVPVALRFLQQVTQLPYANFAQSSSPS